MAFSVGDFGYPIRAADGTRILVPCSFTKTVDDFALPALLAGGGRTLIKASLGPHGVDDVVLPARLDGGGRTLANLKTRGPYICNSCDPPLYDEYVVTIEGVTGDCSYMNKSYVVKKVEGFEWCLWTTTGSEQPSEPYPFLQLYITPFGSNTRVYVRYFPEAYGPPSYKFGEWFIYREDGMAGCPMPEGIVIPFRFWTMMCGDDMYQSTVTIS